MSREILNVAIDTAKANGWSTDIIVNDFDDLPYRPDGDGGYVQVHPFEMLFDQQFARALWPFTGEVCVYCGVLRYSGFRHPSPCPYECLAEPPLWRHHLQQMVVSPDPIDYLGKHLKEVEQPLNKEQQA